MKFVETVKKNIQKRKILKLDDTDKVYGVKKLEEDENIEEVILSIDDKHTRAKALEKSIDKIESKDVLKRIVKTLKDDDLLKLLNKKVKYLENEDRNILYTTISSIDNPEKKIRTIRKFIKKLSDFEISDLLASIKEKKGENKFENEKIDIISLKILHNYIASGTVMHIQDLMMCLNDKSSNIKVLEKCLEKNKLIEEKIRNERFNDTCELLGNKGKELLLNKTFETINGEKSLERKKARIAINLYEEGCLSHETTREIIEKGVKNKNIRE